MATPKTRHTLALEPILSDRLSDMAARNGLSLNQAFIYMMEIGLNVAAEQFGSDLNAAVTSSRNAAQPAAPRTRKAAAS